MVVEAGYQALFSAHGGFIGEETEFYDIPRIGVCSEHSPLALMMELEGLSLANLRYRLRKRRAREGPIASVGIKRIVQSRRADLAFPCALLAGFGRFERAFEFFAHPGVGPRPSRQLSAGGLLCDDAAFRVARMSYRIRDRSLRIRKLPWDTGSTLASLCVLGQTIIGDRTQIASGVQILSGRRQHGRSQGRAHGRSRSRACLKSFPSAPIVGLALARLSWQKLEKEPPSAPGPWSRVRFLPVR